MRALVASWLVVLTSCGLSTPIEAQHPSVQRVPGSIDGSTEERHAALVATAKGDLACVNVDVVLTLDRRYANSVVVRHVVEGCGKRALYVETCEAYPSCRYLVVSVLPLASVGRRHVARVGSTTGDAKRSITATGSSGNAGSVGLGRGGALGRSRYRGVPRWLCLSG